LWAAPGGHSHLLTLALLLTLLLALASYTCVLSHNNTFPCQISYTLTYTCLLLTLALLLTLHLRPYLQPYFPLSHFLHYYFHFLYYKDKAPLCVSEQSVCSVMEMQTSPVMKFRNSGKYGEFLLHHLVSGFWQQTQNSLRFLFSNSTSKFSLQPHLPCPTLLGTIWRELFGIQQETRVHISEAF
jgi:hypothetical protein